LWRLPGEDEKMKEKVTIDNTMEIAYIKGLIEKDIQYIEQHLKGRQELLRKFSDRSGK